MCVLLIPVRRLISPIVSPSFARIRRSLSLSRICSARTCLLIRLVGVEFFFLVVGFFIFDCGWW
jgi:hypothetical protein